MNACIWRWNRRDSLAVWTLSAVCAGLLAVPRAEACQIKSTSTTKSTSSTSTTTAKAASQTLVSTKPDRDSVNAEKKAVKVDYAKKLDSYLKDYQVTVQNRLATPTTSKAWSGTPAPAIKPSTSTQANLGTSTTPPQVMVPPKVALQVKTPTATPTSLIPPSTQLIASPVPEPTTWLLTAGMAAWGVLRRRAMIRRAT